MSEGPAVAVCIVTHDSAADLPDCLQAVAAQSHRPLEIVVVDCASQDGSMEAARAHAPAGIPFQAVALGENLGFAGGMNAAFARTRAPFVLTLNADARPAPDYVSRLLSRALAHPDLRVGAVAGRLVRPAADGRPRLLDACGMRLTRTWRHLDRGSGEVDRGQWSSPERVFGATGAASLFRREALDDAAVEGEIFDARFHTFREDAELCFRLRERGWEVLYEPAAVAEHRRSTADRCRIATCCGSITRPAATSCVPCCRRSPATWERSAGSCCASDPRSPPTVGCGATAPSCCAGGGRSRPGGRSPRARSTAGFKFRGCHYEGCLSMPLS